MRSITPINPALARQAKRQNEEERKK